MSRPQRKGIDYFPMDVNFFADPKVKILKARYGVDGITIYMYLLCEIYKAGYYIVFSDDSMFVLSDELKMSSDKVKQVLNFLLERSLLDSKLFQSDKVLTSTGIQKRFQLAVKERAKKNPIEIKDFWLLEEAETEPFIKRNPFLNNSKKNESNSQKNESNSQEENIKESKVKKSKVNKNIESNLSIPEEVRTALNDFIEFRKKIKSPMTDHAVKLLVDKLINLSSGDKDVMIQILNQSIINGWKGIFELKQDKAVATTNGNGKPRNRFHNFTPREVDYDAMVLQELGNG